MAKKYITITRISKLGPIDMIKQVEAKAAQIKKGLKLIANIARDHMIAIIQRNSQDWSEWPNEGQTGDLGQSITVEKIKGGYGVGKISSLKKYWAKVNWGGKFDIGKHGFVQKIVFVRPMHYIEKTHHKISMTWKDWMDRIIKNIR